MQEMHGTVMHYPWGTAHAIPEILGIPADGRPYAEYWLGAHPLAPSLTDGEHLDALLASEPALLGERAAAAYSGRLPFMMKLLSARHALSLQAHPDPAMAAEGYAREQAAGIPLDHRERVYRDPNGKPELLVALTDFELLLGFRPASQTAELIRGLGLNDDVLDVFAPLTHRRGSAALQQVFLEVLTLADDRADLVNQFLVGAVRHVDDPGLVGDLARLIVTLDETFPADPGILAACLMNRVTLAPGEAVFTPPGMMHADIAGTGVEILSNSDNVVRGGLTDKHIAVDELVRIVDFEAMQPEVLSATQAAPGVWRYPASCDEFVVWRLEGGESSVEVPGYGTVRVALVTRGHGEFADASGTLQLEHGQAVFLPATNSPVRLSGDAQVFVAAPGMAI